MNMDDILLQEAIERYLTNQMPEAERAYFDQLRTNTPEIDQMVVEHAMFQHEMDFYSQRRNFSAQLHNAHANLLQQGKIQEGTEISNGGKLIQIFHKYKLFNGLFNF